MKTICEKGKILGVKYRNTSQYGNPSYWVYFTNAKGELQYAYTRSNSSIGFAIQNYDGKEVNIFLHNARKSCIIDNVEEIPR